MAETVNLFGHPVKKGYVIGGGVVFGAVAVYYIRRQKAAPAAASAAASSPGAAGDQYPPDGTTGNPSDPYSTDPGTGSTYGNEANGGYVGNGVSNLGGYYGNTGLYGAGTGTEGPGTFTSNAYWAQYVEQLMGSSGNDSVSQAIGAYITGAAVTPDQVSVIEQAIAVAGYPPVSGTNGYPPSISTGGSGSPATVTVPDVEGRTLTSAQQLLTAAGLVLRAPSGASGTGTVKSQSPAAGTAVAAGSTVTVTVTTASSSGGGTGSNGSVTPAVSGGHVVHVSNNDAVVAWTGHGAVRYRVKITGPGKINGFTNTVPVARATYSGLEAGHDYTVTVTPIGANGKAGRSGNINVKTTR